MAFPIDRVAIAIIVRKMAMPTMAIMNEISMILVAIINANSAKHNHEQPNHPRNHNEHDLIAISVT